MFNPEQYNAHPLPPMDETPDDMQDVIARLERQAVGLKQASYHTHRRAYAESIGRPYAEERHPCWPR